LTGIGTLVDALYAIRRLVYEEVRLSLGELAEILASDFAGEEALRQYVIHRLPKFGHDDPEVAQFAAEVFAQVAQASSGMPNTRGGVYEASLFSFRTFTSMGNLTGATPDGRRAGEHLSPGMSPSQLALGEQTGVGQLLRCLEALDLAQYPVVAVLDVKLPLAPAGYEPQTLLPIILRFIECGGSVLQINCLDPATLRAAQAHPERHPDLVVRVSGYSAYFNTLCTTLQDEIIERALVESR
ncbi:MAG: pyruvate formate lyase family protein, partial [Armatimonadota bacterium]